MLAKNAKMAGGLQLGVGKEVKDLVRYYGRSNSMEDEEDPIYKNPIITCFMYNRLILLKEKFEHWEFFDESQKLKEHFKKNHDLHSGSMTVTPEEDKLYTQGLHDKAAAAMREVFKYKMIMFKVVTIINIDDVQFIDVHKGKLPTVELQCYKRKGKERGKYDFDGI